MRSGRVFGRGVKAGLNRLNGGCRGMECRAIGDRDSQSLSFSGKIRAPGKLFSTSPQILRFCDTDMGRHQGCPYSVQDGYTVQSRPLILNFLKTGGVWHLSDVAVS